jgi:outer membrane protein OmpA-like peptidoglycan-associated protein
LRAGGRWPIIRPMPRVPAVTLLVAATVIMHSTPAQEIPSPSRFSLGATGMPGVLGTASAHSLRAGETALDLAGRARSDAGIFRDGSMAEDAFLVSSAASGAAGLGHGIDLGLSLPYYYEYLPGTAGNMEETGVGDVEAALHAGLAFRPWLHGSLFTAWSFPTGGVYPDEAVHSLGSSKARGGGGAALTFDFTPWIGARRAMLHLNIEGRRAASSPDADDLGWVKGSAAAEGWLWPWLSLSGEYGHEKLVSDAWDWSKSPAHANTLGLVAAGFYNGFALRLGALFAPEAWNPLPSVRSYDGLRMGYRPYAAASAYLAVTWQGFPLHHDQDGDGMVDGQDACPFRAEDRDGFEDADGCPDPDNDRDGVADSLDKCPSLPEDHDGFEDYDGCPDPDNDHDGIADSLDACVNDAEDRDGFQDQDGCPEFDNDKDGIPDASDRCPNEPEDKNGFEDGDGCPEPDSDKDGIPDKIDQCPREAEIVNFYQDKDGCPDERPEPVHTSILAGVSFKPGTADLNPSSYPVLDSLAALMQAYPGTEIEIQGHLDNQAVNAQALSEAMASAVAGYLAHKGVEPRRMKPAGYGATRPMASNRTAHGRQANRRVEIVRLN